MQSPHRRSARAAGADWGDVVTAITPSLRPQWRALGPFEPAPRTCGRRVGRRRQHGAWHCWPTRWARERGGSLLALVVDHGLRPEFATGGGGDGRRGWLRVGIAARLLTIDGLARGSALAERARAARFAALEAACAATGILHLLLGHHAADQAETLLIRALGGSGPAGMAGMAPLVETTRLRLLRPLLAVAPGRLRATLSAAGVAWVEDPSNADQGGAAAAAAAAASGPRRRRGGDRRPGRRRGCVRPKPGRARIEMALPTSPRRFRCGPRVSPAVGASARPSLRWPRCSRQLPERRFRRPRRSVAALAAAPRPATLAGVRLLPAGRLGPGLLAVREPAAMAPPVPARPGAVWDGRFRLGDAAVVPPGATLGALGADAARLRRFSSLPAAVLRTLPAIRRGDNASRRAASGLS